MKEFINLYISNIYELGFIILWMTYGFAYGFKNWVLRLWCLCSFSNIKQNGMGKILDMLFLVSMSAFVMFKQGYFNF